MWILGRQRERVSLAFCVSLNYTKNSSPVRMYVVKESSVLRICQQGKKTHSLANKRCNRHHFLSEQRNLLKLQDDPLKNVHADNVIRSSIHFKIWNFRFQRKWVQNFHLPRLNTVKFGYCKIKFCRGYADKSSIRKMETAFSCEMVILLSISA